MNKNIMLFLLSSPLLCAFLINTSNCYAFNYLDRYMDFGDEIYRLTRQGFKIEDPEQRKKLDLKIAELKVKRSALEPFYTLFTDIKNSGLYEDSMLNTLADAVRFVYTNADLHGNDKYKLKNRLKIYQLGEISGKHHWNIATKNANEIAEVYHLVNMALQLDDIPSEKYPISDESPQEMLEDIKQRCENNRHLNEYYTQRHITDTVARGLKVRAEKTQV